MIRPSSIQVPTLLDHPWDLLLILPGTEGLPRNLRTPEHLRGLYTLHAGIPSSITKSWACANEKLLRPAASDVPALTGSLDKPRIAPSAQDLELSPDLKAWYPTWEANGAASGKGAISMLNFLAFKPGMQEEYLKYGKAFAETIGKRRGGTAKIVGKVVADPGQKSRERQEVLEWDEIALAHYPSIRHFADMIASEDYQEVNHKHRVLSLKDTCILMTSELDLPDVGGAGKSRL